jgi:methyl-accepting chemotaxis protein
MSFLKLRIAGRLYIGFGILLLFCLGLAGFAIWQLGGVRDNVADMIAQSRSSIRVSDIAAELEGARRGILRYLFDQDEASFTEADQHLSKVANLIDDQSRTVKSEERRAAYRAMLPKITELNTKKGALGDAVIQMKAGRAQLFADGDKMAADTQKFVDAALDAGIDQIRPVELLQANVLLAQVATWHMLATRDPKGSDVFKSDLQKAQQQIAEIEKAGLPAVPAAMLGLVKTSIAKYDASFDKAAKNMLQGDELFYKTLSPAMVDTIGEMGQIKGTMTKAFETTSDQANGNISSTITTQEIVAGSAVVLGLLIAFLIARGIIRPLSGLTAGMKELADGNFGVVLPGLDRKDEVGDMAQARPSRSRPKRKPASKPRPRSSRIRLRPGNARRT